MSFNRIDSVNGDSIEIRLRQLGAVSYTHLDVYKRQRSLWIDY